MISQVYCTIKDRLASTGFFTQIYEYCDHQVRSDGTQRPMYYEGGGWKDVHNFDRGNTAYVRKRGTVSFRDYNRPKMTSCGTGTVVEMTIPIRIVCALHRYDTSDESMADELLALDVIGTVQGDLSLGSVWSSSLKVPSYDTSNVSVWKTENVGIPFDEAKLTGYAYIALDCNVKIVADVQCIQNCLQDAYL